MIESAIIALREGIEIALVMGIVIAYLRKLNQLHLMKAAYAGLIAAIGASAAGGWLLLRLGIDSEALEGYFLIFAALFVGTMVVWMWKTARSVRGEVEESLGKLIAKHSSRRLYIAMFTFSFFMVLREGMETAIFLQAVALSAGAWKSILGTLAGLTGALIFGILFIRGSVRIDIGRFLKITACTLIIFTLQLLVNAVHEFFENGILPASPKAMSMLGPIVQNDALFIAAIMSIPAFMLFIPGKTSRAAELISQKRWRIAAGVGTLCVIMLLGGADLFSGNRSPDLSAQLLTPGADGILSIPIASVSDGKLHRYEIADSSLKIRFFILQTGPAAFATSFDACKACYSYGRYYLKNGDLICSQCDAPSPLASLKPTYVDPPRDSSVETNAMEANGCHPIFLPSRVENGSIIITLADLRSQRQYFDVSEEAK